MPLSFLIQTSPDQRLFASFPGLIAGYHVFRRLSMPRHPPCTLSSLTTFTDHRPSPGRGEAYGQRRHRSDQPRRHRWPARRSRTSPVRRQRHDVRILSPKKVLDDPRPRRKDQWPAMTAEVSADNRTTSPESSVLSRPAHAGGSGERRSLIFR